MKKVLKLQRLKSTLGAALLMGGFLSFGQSAAADSIVPTHESVKIEAYTTNREYKGTVGLHLDFGWEYITLVNKNNGMVIEPSGGHYKIRAYNPNSPKYDYWTVSDRGYVYLSKQSSAQAFRITKVGDYYCISKNERPLTTYWWGGDDFVTVGPQSTCGDTLWKIKKM